MANAIQKPTTINVDARTLPDLKCPDCGSFGWVPLYLMKYLSKFQSPTGQDQIIHNQIGWVCRNCGGPLDINTVEKVYPEKQKNNQKVKPS